ncbi:MAG TPA: cation:proton antiporter [Solirubrobacter sp.]|jgi:Kef-type K+ transport system membrane component KefB|nr:cation:proton antiporter [Solirubrobacter sp.]
MVEPGSFLIVVAVGALAGTLATMVTGRGLLFPTVVAELLLGVVIGPQVLGLEVDDFMTFVSALGLGMLFFFAGYEIDLRRIAGLPLRLAVVGWLFSLAIAYSIGGVLAAAGIVLSLLYTGSALATTAIGTLIPILSDNGELRTRMGTYLLAAGAVGEFGPILLLTLVLSTQGALHNALILTAFVVLAVVVAVAAMRSSSPALHLFEQTLEKSSQLAVRWVVVLVFALALLAYELGLDLLLGGFAAGMITRQVLQEREIPGFDSKLTGVAFGFFVPFFFVVSGMQLDVAALFSSAGAVAKMFLFFGLFLVVRGTPALLLYRDALNRSERLALAFFSSTQLPLVLAITTLARETGHMHASTATSLVCAAVLSTLIFPMLGLRMRRPTVADEPRELAVA